MNIKNKLTPEIKIIIGFAFAKLVIHTLTATNYELHRDAFLYLAQADHLDWGYFSTPPLTPFFTKIMVSVFGYSDLVVRLLPALIGMTAIIFVGLITIELGGKKWAVFLGCLAFLISPAFLRSNTLLQPISFNQLFWIISSYFFIRMLKTENPKYWIHLGIIWGIAFLNKYSIVFLALAIVISLMISPKRKLLISKYTLYGLFIGFTLILPNLLWQNNNDWPVIMHMLELQRTQLVNVNLADFWIMQFIMNYHALLIWIAGLLFLFFGMNKKYRPLAFTFVFLILILILLRGKHYYSLGIYPLLLAAGAVAFEHYFQKKKAVIYGLIVLMLVLALNALPHSLPVLSPPKMAAYARFSSKLGFEGALRWEDGQIHELPQDYADMNGWRELTAITAKAWNKLSVQEQKNTVIYAENYGLAGAIKYYGKSLGLPEPISFHDSFLFWAPDSLNNMENFIYINDEPGEDIEYFFKYFEKIGVVNNPYFRENGTQVYLGKKPDPEFYKFYSEKVNWLKYNYTNE